MNEPKTKMRELKKSECWTSLGELKRKQKILIGICVILAFIGGSTGIYAGIRIAEAKAEAEQVWQEHLKRQEIKNNDGYHIQDNTEVDGGAVGADVQVEAASTEPRDTPEKSAGEEQSLSPAPGNIEDKILAKFGEDGKIALAIAKAESGLVSKRSHKMNSNGTYDWGIMQVNDCHCKKIEGDCHEKLLDPDFNIEFSYGIYERSGKTFGPWSAYTSKRYLAYL